MSVQATSISVWVPPPSPLKALITRDDRKDNIALVEDVSLFLRPGQVTALLGPSGSGKSVLLDVLAGRLSSSLRSSGELLYNGRVLQPSDVASISGFIEQEDVMLSDQTTRENLTFLAALTLPTIMTRSERKTRVDAILAALGMSKVADTRVGVPGLKRGLSGGERKRATIAQSLIASPRILYVDDPTAGLDAATARSVMQVFRSLASQRNITILVSLAQASAEILNMVDSILALAEGKVAYSGPADGMIPFFESVGYACPEGANPADFAVSLLSTDHHENAYEEAEAKTRVGTIIAAADKEGMGRPVPPCCDPHESDPAKLEGTRTSVWTHLTRLIHRNAVLQFRNKQATWARTLQFLIFGLFFGALYFQLNRRVEGGYSRMGFFFIYSVLLPYIGIQSAITQFVPERATFMRESSERLYSTWVYLAAKVLADFPMVVVNVTLCAVPVYYLIGLENEADKFLIFYGLSILLSVFGSWLGLALSAATGSADAANILAPGLVMPASLFAGMLIKPGSIPPALAWIRFLSFLKYAYNIFAENELKDIAFVCGTGPCPVPGGQQVLDLFEVEDDGSMNFNFAMLGIIAVLVLLSVYIALLFSKRR